MPRHDVRRLLEAHNLGQGVFYTTPLFWDCECETDYIHPASHETCPACTAVRQDCPDARLDEVLKYGSRWPVELTALLEALAEQVVPNLTAIPF